MKNEMNWLTVGELKKILEKYPDEYLVTYDRGNPPRICFRG